MWQNQHGSSTHAITPIQWAIHASNFAFVFHLEISEIQLNHNLEVKGQKSANVSKTCMGVLYACASLTNKLQHIAPRIQFVLSLE